MASKVYHCLLFTLTLWIAVQSSTATTSMLENSILFNGSCWRSDESLCEHVCVACGSERYYCQCRPGYRLDSDGMACTATTAPFPFLISHESSMWLPRLPASVVNNLNIELVIKPTSLNGSILQCGQSANTPSDTISLILEDGHIVFRFDLGTGPAEIWSLYRINTNEWFQIHASRTGKYGRMYVTGQPVVFGQSLGVATQLNLTSYLFLGQDVQQLTDSLSFNGCVGKIVVNDRVYDIDPAKKPVFNVEKCSSCFIPNEPCLNGGLCRATLHDYTCYCPLGFSNTNCEDVQHGLPTIPRFNGNSYLMYTDPDIANRMGGTSTNLMGTIKPQSRNGLIFWTAQSTVSSHESAPRDFMAVGLSEGVLQFYYDLGSGETLITNDLVNLFDGDWHFFWASINDQSGYVMVDFGNYKFGHSPGNSTILNSNMRFYLGGILDVQEVTGGRFNSSYRGCMNSVTLQDIGLNLVNQSVVGANIEECESN